MEDEWQQAAPAGQEYLVVPIQAALEWVSLHLFREFQNLCSLCKPPMTTARYRARWSITVGALALELPHCTLGMYTELRTLSP